MIATGGWARGLQALCSVAIVCFAAAADGCTLPDFKKIEGSEDPAENKDSGPADAPGCSMDIDFQGACRACIAEHCCTEASACNDGACGTDLTMPINPLSKVTSRFDGLASCMLEHCNSEDTCDTSWGCVDNYKWPPLRETHKFEMRVFNYADANEKGIPGIDVRFCETSDPGCAEGSGLIATGRTDSMGSADFTSQRGYTGYFELEGGDTTDAVIQWSQPVYNVVDMFTHQALQPSAVTFLAIASKFHDSADQKFKPGTGFLIARAQNCLPLRYMEGPNPIARARDVELEFTPSTGASRVFYVNDMASLDLALEQTSTRGYAGAFEVLVGNVTVTARHAVSKKALAVGTLAIREAAIGFMYLVPEASR